MKTLNPYSELIHDVGRPFKWVAEDIVWRMRREHRHSKNHLAAVQGQFKRKKAVILCNGPSLLKVDFQSLQNCFVIGLNKINLLFSKTTLRPDCIVAVNKLVIEQNADFFNSTDIQLYLDSYATKHVKTRKNICFLHAIGKCGFAENVSSSVFHGSTVTYVAMQLAFHLGFESVALVGCDHSFAVSGPANKTVVSREKDESHFDPNYFAGGVKWQLPDLAGSEIAYIAAREAFSAAGREIFNCTDGGKLEVFKRLPLSEFVRQPE